MKIGIVCYPTFGGSGVVATELGHALANRDHEIHFITYKQPVRLNTLHAHVNFHEVNVPDYPLFQYQPYALALSSKLVKVVKEQKLELLHVHYAIPHAYAAYMAQKMLQDQGLYIPFVTTLHGTDITLVGSHPFYKDAVAFSINHSNVVTSVSKSLKRDTLRLFDIKKEIKVIYNFIDSAFYINRNVPCERDRIAQKGEKIITHISNFRPPKRVMDVIRCFELIQKKCPSKLMMIGDGVDRARAQAYCKEKGFDEKVHFLGKTHEIDRVLCFSDLFLLPSEQESFGLAALEAMIHKVPVISSNAGGLSEVNIEGVSGYLLEVGDYEGMARKALSILNDSSVLASFKEKAFHQARKFDIKAIVAQYEAVYQAAILSQIY
ncbi:MAG: N-acetyl-alpha-D-glucosaminyl L-malate synthase BshA [Flavobacteriaceae bacterium]